MPTPQYSTMISRSSLARNAQQAVRRSCSVRPVQRRAFAAAASSGAFETADVNGLKVASRDAHGPTTKLAVVAKAGTRYQPLPGLTLGLEEFAFKVSFLSTQHRKPNFANPSIFLEHAKTICTSNYPRVGAPWWPIGFFPHPRGPCSRG